MKKKTTKKKQNERKNEIFTTKKITAQNHNLENFGFAKSACDRTRQTLVVDEA